MTLIGKALGAAIGVAVAAALALKFWDKKSDEPREAAPVPEPTPEPEPEPDGNFDAVEEDEAATESPAPMRQHVAEDVEDAPTDPGAGEEPEHEVIDDEPVEVYGILFEAAQAAATVAFTNAADEQALQAAGLKGKALKLVVEGRPFASIEALGATSGIGKKTVEALFAATK